MPRRSRRWPLRLLGRAVALLAVLTAGCALAPGRAAAASAYIDGISDQNLGLWSGDYADASGLFDPSVSDFFASAWVGPSGAQHLRYARFVTAPDVVAQGGACEANLDAWFTYVTQTLHLIPVVAVWNVAEGGCADDGVPSSAAYATDVQQLLGHLDGLFPATTLPYLEAWNEPNSSGVAAASAAAYWTAAADACASAGCTAIAGDLVDNDPDQGSQSFAPGCAAGLTYDNLAAYERDYVAALGPGVPTIWGFHPYFAVNCEQSTSVTTFEAGLPGGGVGSAQVWFTEVAAWECVKGRPSARGAEVQQADAQYLTGTLMAPNAPNPPEHVFWYEMAAPQYTLDCSKYSDSELYEASSDPGELTARPAAATVYGPDTSLAAAAAPPSAVSSTQATFNGAVTPGGIYEASYYFEYGPTTGYGSSTPAVALGPGLTPQAVSSTVSGLVAATPYHYRLVATDTLGLTVDGPDVLMAPVLIAASASTVTAGTAITVSWSGISNPSAADWVGLYQPGAPAGVPVASFYAGSCTSSAGAAAAAAGSCSYTMPALPGTYELRLYSAPGASELASSSEITSVPPPPSSTSAPLISGASDHGRAYPGDTLSCSEGGWTNEPTAYTFSWSAAGVTQAAATGPTYLVPAGQIGQALICAVSATNAGGSGGPALSAAVAVVSPRPVSSSPPLISGAPLAGDRLIESHASWSNAPTAFSYQWQRCDRAGAHCEAIAAATERDYTLRSADVGARIRVVETASNARARSAPAPSLPTAVVLPPPPRTLISAATVELATASFQLAARGATTGFRCALVRMPAHRGAPAPRPVYSRCGRVVTYDALAPAQYVFYAQAVGPGGADPRPPAYRFVIR
jgi:hypothetical protein